MCLSISHTKASQYRLSKQNNASFCTLKKLSNFFLAQVSFSDICNGIQLDKKLRKMGKNELGNRQNLLI